VNSKRELDAATELKRADVILAKPYTHQAMPVKILSITAQCLLLSDSISLRRLTEMWGKRGRYIQEIPSWQSATYIRPCWPAF